MTKRSSAKKMARTVKPFPALHSKANSQTLCDSFILYRIFLIKLLQSETFARHFQRGSQIDATILFTFRQFSTLCRQISLPTVAAQNSR